MFTQCPKCETIFKLSADVLRAAAGEVRCGRCGEIFNALSSLAEEPQAFSKGESPQEQEARADNILRFAPPEPPAPQPPIDAVDFDVGPGVEIAHLEIQGAQEDIPPWAAARPDQLEDTSDTEDDASLEFTLPPGELDRIFIEARPWSIPRPPLPARPTDETSPESMPEPEPEPQSIVFEAPSAPVTGSDVPHSAPSDLPEHPEHAERRAAFAPIAPDREWLNADVHPPVRRTPWWIAAGALSVLLIGQLVHQNRESLANASGIGSSVRSLYAAIGDPIPLRTNLAGFEVRQWGVTGDASANGTLRVRASVINISDLPQPYPLLRLTLADRFGARIGSRDFLPKEYLKHEPSHALDPRERADAVIEIVDPGKTAEGFEIDVCARASNGRVSCANDGAAAAKP